MSYSCLVFDLDGTLADTPTAIARTVVAAIAATGHPEPSVEAALATVGRPLDEAFRRLLPEGAWGSVPECVYAYRDIYERTVVPATQLFPGVVDTLLVCRSVGLRLGIATTKLTPVARTTLAHCGILGLFDSVCGGDRASLPKPAPELALAVLEELRCAPREALMVGDTTYDIEMGHAAGTATCAVTYGAHSREQLASANPNFTIDQFTQLKVILGL